MLGVNYKRDMIESVSSTFDKLEAAGKVFPSEDDGTARYFIWLKEQLNVPTADSKGRVEGLVLQGSDNLIININTLNY